MTDQKTSKKNSEMKDKQANGMAIAVSENSGKKGAKSLHHLEIHHAKNGGHIVRHHFNNSGSLVGYHDPEEFVFGNGQGGDLLAHVADQMGVPGGGEEKGEPEHKSGGAGGGQDKGKVKLRPGKKYVPPKV